jgi:hypothetical protein
MKGQGGNTKLKKQRKLKTKIPVVRYGFVGEEVHMDE